MYNLLMAGLRRTLHSPFWWIAVCAALCFGAFFGDMVYDGSYVDVAYFIFLQGLFGVVIALSVGREWEEGGLRNKIIKGHGKGRVFFSEVILAVAQSLFLTLFSVLIFCIFSGGFLTSQSFNVCMNCLLALLLLRVVTAVLDVALCMLIPSRAVAVVLCILLVVGMALAADEIDVALKQSEQIRDTTLVYNEESGHFEIEQGAYVENPNYVGGAKRSVYLLLQKLIPVSQAEGYFDLLNLYLSTDQPELDPKRPTMEQALLGNPLYTLGLIAALCTAGCLGFCKRDMK